MEITPRRRDSVYYIEGKLEGYKNNETFELIVPYTDSVIESVLDETTKQGLNVDVNKDPGSISWISINKMEPLLHQRLP